MSARFFFQLQLPVRGLQVDNGLFLFITVFAEIWLVRRSMLCHYSCLYVSLSVVQLLPILTVETVDINPVLLLVFRLKLHLEQIFVFKFLKILAGESGLVVFFAIDWFHCVIFIFTPLFV